MSRADRWHHSRRVLAPGVGAVLLAAGAAFSQNGPLEFIFDDGFRGSNCLSFDFSRPVPTVDSDGTAVPQDVPRAGRSESLTGAPVFEVVRKGSLGVKILGSGVERDGTTPVMVTYEGTGGYLDVFTVAGSAILEAEKTGVGRIRTFLDPSEPDMMHGEVEGKRYEPVSAVVCHGLIAVFCVVRTPDVNNGEWVDASVAFFTSQDDGQTWSLHYEDAPVQVGKNRGREWAMQNWWPVTQGPGPKEAFIVAADYRGNPGSNGGRMYMFRLTRANADSTWKIEPGERLHEEAGVTGQHFHAAALVPLPGGGLRAIIAVGDAQDINRVIGLTRADHSYRAPGWIVNQTYHGAMGFPGLMANQFCGAAPGPRLGDVIVGSDLDDEQLMLMTIDGPEDHPKTSWLYGRSWVDGRRSANFLVKTPYPELGTGPYVSKYDPHKATEEGLLEPRRGLYSPDGLAWAQAFMPGTSGNWTLAIHGEHIYFTRAGAPQSGLLRCPLPPMRTMRPLAVGPGGVQRLVPSPSAFGPGIEVLQRSQDGLWVDGGIPLDPQPPCAGAVFRCRASVNDASTRIGEINVAGPADVGDVLGTDAVQIRLWMKSLQDHKTERPRFQFGTVGMPTQMLQSTDLSCTGDWFSIDAIGAATIAPGETAKLGIRSGGATPDDEDFYLAIDAVGEGVGFPGYPMPPDATNPPAGTVSPDEIASVTGFVCGDAWTVTLAGQLPQDGWDQSITGVDEWPLCTLWGNEDNYVSLVADSAGGRLVARVVRDGAVAGGLESAPLFWLRGSSILVSLSDDGAGVQMTLSAAGLEVQEATVVDQPASPGVGPTRIRLGDATGKTGGGKAIRVSPMLWFGGRVDASIALDASARRELLTSLSFLDEPETRSADLDGDGQRTLFDFLVFQNLFLADDPLADFDGNGVLDLFDFFAFANAFNGPC